jgi:hypothetical protein
LQRARHIRHIQIHEAFQVGGRKEGRPQLSRASRKAQKQRKLDRGQLARVREVYQALGQRAGIAIQEYASQLGKGAGNVIEEVGKGSGAVGVLVEGRDVGEEASRVEGADQGEGGRSDQEVSKQAGIYAAVRRCVRDEMSETGRGH